MSEEVKRILEEAGLVARKEIKDELALSKILDARVTIDAGWENDKYVVGVEVTIDGRRIYEIKGYDGPFEYVNDAGFVTEMASRIRRRFM